MIIMTVTMTLNTKMVVITNNNNNNGPVAEVEGKVLDAPAALDLGGERLSGLLF